MTNHMADRIEDKGKKIEAAFHLLLEARDALPAITMTAAKLHGVSLSLADRIERWLEPWQTTLTIEIPTTSNDDKAGAFLSSVAEEGLDSSSKVGQCQTRIHLTENCEIAQCSEKAEASIREQDDHKPNG